MRSSTFLLLGAGALVQGRLFGQSEGESARFSALLEQAPAPFSSSISSAMDEVMKFSTVSGYSALESAVRSRATQFAQTATASEIAILTQAPEVSEEYVRDLMKAQKYISNKELEIIREVTDKKEYMPSEQQDAFVKAYENVHEVTLDLTEDFVDDALGSASTVGATRLLGAMLAVGVAVVLAL